MPIAQVSSGIASDEDALVAAIASLASTVGWTVYGPAGTYPAGSYWFVSPGEDGCSHIVGGLLANSTTRRMRPMIAADIDTSGIANANVGGWMNNDAVAISTPAQAFPAESNTIWYNRDAGLDYYYWLVIDLDAITCFVTYTALGVLAQGIIEIGCPEDSLHGRKLYSQAKAKIDSIATNGADRTITLDRDITAALKDRSAYPSDPHTMRLFFQPINSHGGGAEDNDFGMVERFPIVDGTLTTVGGQTQFDIAISGGAKLGGAAGRRYNDNRGVGDIVRLSARPNYITCIAAQNEGNFSRTANNIMLAWDNYGGQRAGASTTLNLDGAWMNESYEQADECAPSPLSGLAAEHRLYLMSIDREDNLIAQVDREGSLGHGASKHIVIVPNMALAHGSYIKVNGQPHRRYRVMGKTAGRGIGYPCDLFAAGGPPHYCCGPGW